MSSINCLRAAVHQLNNTPSKDLPFVAPYLASALSDCGTLLSVSDQEKPAVGGRDAPLLIQKLKARITSLLQDKTPEGRWTSIILVKTVVEAGQWEILRDCEPWVRGLLGILNKPDPSTSMELCIVSLTRIFSLTRRYQTLVREITTPNLPSFITACLNLISTKSSQQGVRVLKPNQRVLEPVLCSFGKLLPSYPTVFRPFSSQIHDVVLPMLDSNPAPTPITDSGIELAQQLFTSLHHCAPKNTFNEEWVKACRSTMLSAHQTANDVFRAISEQWESVDPSVKQMSTNPDPSRSLGSDGPDPLGLHQWEGLREGCVKITSLIRLLTKFILTRTQSTVSIPLGSIFDLTSRLMSVTVPAQGVDVSNIVNPGVSRNEREALWSELPHMHVATLDLLQSIVESLGCGSLSIAQACLQQSLWIFESESFNSSIRAATYRIIATVLPVLGFGLAKADISSLTPAVRAACNDLRGPESTGNDTPSQGPSGKGKSRSQSATANADTFLNPNLKGDIDQLVTVTDSLTGISAAELLRTLLGRVPVDLISPTVRTEIDRTSILLQQKQVMMASVLNPIPANGNQGGHASILPFLARNNSRDLEVEGFLRPRMPVLMDSGSKKTLDLSAIEDDMELDVAPVDSLEQKKDIDPEPETTITSVDPLELERQDDSTRQTEIRNKRQYNDETKGLYDHSQLAPGPQEKKARIESNDANASKESGFLPDIPTLPVPDLSPTEIRESSSTAQPAAATSRTQIPPEPKSSQAPPTQLVPAGQNPEESDDEIPELNVEPDTEDEENGME